MKKLLLILLLLVPCLLSAQNGLGDFKINKTKIDFVISKYPDFKEVTDSTDYYLTRRFQCEKFRMLNIDVTGIEVYFYNDLLISFRCDRNPLIENYLASKYGRPEITQNMTKVKTDFVIYDEEYTSYVWEDDGIKIISTYTKQFNDHFKVLTNCYFYIYLKGSEKITKYNGSKN